MITAVDTSVLLDVFGADPTFGPASRAALDRCIGEGSLVGCDVVWAEVGGAFGSPADAEAAMDALGVGFVPMSQGSALGASVAWRAYRSRGGARPRPVADFLVGAHAVTQAERLLTRDRGFYRSYFGGLVVVDPAT